MLSLGRISPAALDIMRGSVSAWGRGGVLRHNVISILRSAFCVLRSELVHSCRQFRELLHR